VNATLATLGITAEQIKAAAKASGMTTKKPKEWNRRQPAPVPPMPKRAGMKYTQVDRDFVCFLRSQKLTWQQIADQTGFPFGSVHYIATGSTPQRRAMKGTLK
jgi:hypothetical protein